MKHFINPHEFNEIRAITMLSKSPLIVIAGPTATGKSNIALKIAQGHNIAIVNADSRQIYKEIHIGTANPFISTCTLLEPMKLKNVDHFMYSFKSVFDNYSVKDYKSDITILLKNITKKYEKILIVGGTGLFIDSYIYNYYLNIETIDIEKRNILNNLSVEALQSQIIPDSLNQLNESDRLNKYRLIRTIEKAGAIYKKDKPRKCEYIVLKPSFEELKDRIVERTNSMFESNPSITQENEYIRTLEQKRKQKSIIHSTIGYKEFDEYFKSAKTIDEVKEDIIIHTRQYAKRQITWFKKSLEL